MSKTAKTLWVFFCVLLCLHGDEGKKQTLRLVQDDAQDYMVSKIYVLKYVQANDIMPFVMSMVKRYNNNSAVNCIEYGNSNEQILTVTCPVGMMPYVDEFIRIADRDVKIDGKAPGDIIRGTGITRAVYRPKYRSGQDLINIIVNAVIGEGPYGSVYGYDQNSNQIYWKDNSSNTEYMFDFLSWLDRPAPQISFQFSIYEIRESTMRDLGADYLAWKNGPGMDLLGAGFNLTSLKLNEAFFQKLLQVAPSAAGAFSYTYGGFFVAPAFDMSFIRLLQQNGMATVSAGATLTITNNEEGSYSLGFTPEYQNLVKDGEENDKTFIRASESELALTISNPVICFNSVKPDANGLLPYAKEDYAKKFGGNVNFNYLLNVSQVVERNNYGEELTESGSVDSYVTMAVNHEKILSAWVKDSEVEQTVGIPFLCELPVLKYIFGYTTKNKDKTHFFLTVSAEFVHPDADLAELSGRMTSLTELVPAKQ